MKRIFISKKICLFLTTSFIIAGVLLFDQYLVRAESIFPPQNLEAISQSITDNKVTLIWKKPDNYHNIKNYNIYRNGVKIGDANSGNRVAKEYIDRFYKGNSNGDAVKISIHNYKVEKLKSDTEYKFTVRSVDINGKESGDSKAVIVKTKTPSKVFNIEDYGAKSDGTTVNLS